MKYFKERDHYEFFRLHSLEIRTKENALAFMYGMSRNDIMNEPDLPSESTDYSKLF